MRIPDFIRRAVDKPEVVVDNDYVLLSQLRQQFDDLLKYSSRISFKGFGSVIGAMPSFGSAVMGSSMDAAPAPTTNEDDFVPERANPSTEDGLVMLFRQLQEEINLYESEHGTVPALASLKKTLADHLVPEENRVIAPSHLIIPLSKGIKLEDYGCDITLPPLPKAVLVLFLRHPEGIVLKQRASYYHELRSIYGLFCSKDNMEEFEDSCKRLVNVTDDSMDQKITTVNSVFKKNLTIDLAAKYQILGERGGVKSIQLNRDLVKMPKELDRIPLTVLK